MKEPIQPAASIDDRRVAASGYAGIDERRKATAPRRVAPRMRTLKGAQIVVPVGPAVACVVRDISATGARLDLQLPILSNTFNLVFDDVEWPARECRVVWREETRVGVAFETAAVEVAVVAEGLSKPPQSD